MKALLLFFIASLTSCTSHYESDSFDIDSVNQAFIELKLVSTAYEYRVPKSEWPPCLKDIEAKEVHIGKQGIFIELDRFFVDESGLYSPFDNESKKVSKGEDPEFKYLAKSVYSYHRKG